MLPEAAWKICLYGWRFQPLVGGPVMPVIRQRRSQDAVRGDVDIALVQRDAVQQGRPGLILLRREGFRINGPQHGKGAVRAGRQVGLHLVQRLPNALRLLRAITSAQEDADK